MHQVNFYPDDQKYKANASGNPRLNHGPLRYLSEKDKAKKHMKSRMAARVPPVLRWPCKIAEHIDKSFTANIFHVFRNDAATSDQRCNRACFLWPCG